MKIKYNGYFLQSAIFLLNSLFFLTPFVANAQIYDVQAMGAVPDGVTLNTVIIQKAIDECSKTGGEIRFGAGTFLSGTLYLKSNVKIHLNDSAVLLGSPHMNDYPPNDVRYKNALTHNNEGRSGTNRAFLFAEGEHNISFSGMGTINGNGGAPEFDLGDDETPESRARPCMILFVDCKNISLTDIRLTRSAYWLQNYLGCDGLHLKNLKIYNHTNYNNDGMDIDAKNVLIENCNIDVDDDGICMKSHDRNKPCENIVIRNCVIASNCNAIKFGTASIGGLKNVSISKCTIRKASEDRIRHWQQNLSFIEESVTGISGIALESVDGAVINKVKISDIQITGVQTPLFIVLGNRGRKQVGDVNPSPVGSIKDITISNFTAVSHSKMASSIIGLPGHYIENLVLSNISISNMGKGTAAEAALSLPEKPKAYPENRMFGLVYPVSGLFLRHVKNLEVNNISMGVRFQDFRPVMSLDDVWGAKINKLITAPPLGINAAVNIVDCGGIHLSNAVYSTKSKPFVQIKDESSNIVISGFRKYPGWIKVLRR